MLKVLYDHQIFSMQRYGGISRYFAHLNESLNQKEDINSEISLLKSNNHYKNASPSSALHLLGRIAPNSRTYRLNKIYSKYKIAKGKYDILHPTYYHPYFLKYNKKPYVITIHDMIHELFPEFFDPGTIDVRYKRQCIENSTHIIAISHSTKEDIKSILGIEDNRISVIHHGYNQQLTSPSQRGVLVKKVDYLLYVGDRKGYKNFPKLASAIVPLLKQNSTLRLICAGGGPFLPAETELLLRLKIQGQVQQCSVEDRELAGLYRNALAFIYPSLYEGFGLPILEAFQNDCPVVSSNSKCFKEIGQDAIKYFDPHDEHDILTSIQTIIYDRDKANAFIENGRRQLLNFPMDLCIDKTIKVYKDLGS